ncbi:sensor histidine kinase [Streptomyces litchfieldiae]|uniref:histidine kinase n=1 Tax=Streptomyces litchfieldiae TaxID=3075543 RepID=A0ABU2MM44_9ACTN|nr:sensor histidine kinase [Streptomyces sp. DSM 44938]MDT0342679.1 sensor histidine kinase [Streptomyces sp. DSM 44938]
MRATPPPPLLKRLTPRAWTTLAWGGGTAFTFLMRMRLPGEEQSQVFAAEYLYRWDGLTILALASGLVLAGCRRLDRRPLLALGLMLAGSAMASTTLSVGEIPMAQFIAVDVALYFVTAARPLRVGVTGLAMAIGALAGYLGIRVLAGWNVGTSAELAVALTAVIAWLAGRSVHQAHAHARALGERTAAQAVTAERLRIARELHDMVAHSIGIIALQAGAAARVVDTQPDRAREAMSAVETAGRETLSGLRRMLGALRRSEDEPAARRPAPGLGDLAGLAEATTAAGVRVEVRWLGEVRPLPPDIDLSAFRIIQESVTNVVRHAASPSCRVTVDYRDEELAIEVADRGRGGAPAGTGFGLAGMRERAALLHGEFAAGPGPDGGFRVVARLPVPEGVR